MQPDRLEQWKQAEDAAALEHQTTEATMGSGAVSRRGFIQGGLAAAAAGMAATDHAAVSAAPASQETPIGPVWWPSRWGPEDQAGASNWITPSKVLEAARLIRTGNIYELGRVYEAGMPG